MCSQWLKIKEKRVVLISFVISNKTVSQHPGTFPTGKIKMEHSSTSFKSKKAISTNQPFLFVSDCNVFLACWSDKNT